MTNEEILKAMQKRGEAGYGTAMEQARQDEREKMQGVDVWVSRDDAGDASEIWYAAKPERDLDGDYIPSDNRDTGIGGYVPVKIAQELNISPGQCKKFRIVEVQNE